MTDKESEMTDLLPCPFCGSSDIRPAGSKPHHYHRCHGCGCEGPVFFITPDAAADAWNRRADPHAVALLKAEEALTFYADENRQGLPSDGPWGLGSDDFGRRARAALAEIKAITGGTK